MLALGGTFEAARAVGTPSVLRAGIVLALLTWPGSSGELARAARQVPRSVAATATDTLTSPPVLKNLSRAPGTVEVTLTAAPSRLALLPGAVTDAYAYNGTVPGPTLEVHEGDRVTIHFHNDLPEPTTIHWHGLHIPSDMDGSPLRPVVPGGHYDYIFTIKPGTAGTYWYHPHPDSRTGYQIAKGLFGAIIVRAGDDPLPASLTERLLILSDNRFGTDGSVDFPDPLSPQGQVDQENGREGNVLFVNGQVAPTVNIRSGELQRWRVVNVSGARVYRLAISGQTLLHVGDDGGLFERPVEVPDIVLSPSERVELLVRGSGAPGSQATLRTLPYDRYVPQTRPKDWNVAHDLLSMTYSTAPPVSAVPVPPVLRRITALDTAAATATHVIVLSQGLINGRTMDMTRVDVKAPLGGTEIWQLENVVGMDHPFHLHGFEFQVLDRDGVPEPYRSWKDVVNVAKHETVRIIVRYADYPGKWMFHCHILDHEDHGMMGILEVQ
jgi:FtsP/CotA-like multicopper oxidase with cupredoxin domain